MTQTFKTLRRKSTHEWLNVGLLDEGWAIYGIKSPRTWEESTDLQELQQMFLCIPPFKWSDVELVTVTLTIS